MLKKEYPPAKKKTAKMKENCKSSYLVEYKTKRKNKVGVNVRDCWFVQGCPVSA
jgi:hypothetical protein